jgi:hypothetical protein
MTRFFQVFISQQTNVDSQNLEDMATDVIEQVVPHENGFIQWLLYHASRTITMKKSVAFVPMQVIP